METGQSPTAGFAFGRFCVLPQQRQLFADDAPVELGGRAFDVLLALIEARGTMLDKNALMDRVWPGRIVEENNLQAQISTLRKVFGADRGLIRTVCGRGYQFAGEIREIGCEGSSAATPRPPELLSKGEMPPFETLLSDNRRAAAAPQDRLGGSSGVSRGSAFPLGLSANGPSPAKPEGWPAGGVAPAAPPPPTNLPLPVSELIGRDEELREILDLAAAQRLVTLTGAGGIGKTRLALAVARQLLAKFADGVWLVELAALSDPDLVPAAIAAAVGLDLAVGEVSAQRVVQALAAKQVLLILDNCEHVVDAAAGMAEALLQANPAARVVATSREPLRAEGEWIYRVPALAVSEADADDLLRSDAARLFLARAYAARPDFSAERDSGAAIAALCRRLDGLPLAIELAAARAAALGVDALAGPLDDVFPLLSGGRRTAAPRHQSLRATLDWSYARLSESERMILRRLAVFPGRFGLRAACVVAESAELAAAAVIDGLASLIAKSLVMTEGDGIETPYRLPATTHAYALNKLAASGERAAVARRHAEYCQPLGDPDESAGERRSVMAWLADHGRCPEAVRTTDWTVASAGDIALGMSGSAASVACESVGF